MWQAHHAFSVSGARMNRFIALIAGMLLVTLAAGCGRGIVTDPINTDYASDDIEAELEFWSGMEGRPRLSNNEGLHGLFVMADGEDKAKNFEERVLTAKERGWLDSDWSEPEAMSMQRGTMARAIVVICQIKGGVWLQLLGPTKRYATRELVDMEIMSEGTTENLSITGLEYVSVISRARDYINTQAMKNQPPQAPAAVEPEAPAEPAPEPMQNGV